MVYPRDQFYSQLFFIYINYRTIGAKSKLSSFANDIKLTLLVKMLVIDIEESNLYILITWAHGCQLSFNLNKCKVLYIRNKNRKFKGHWLESVKEERDLGVKINSSIKFLFFIILLLL